MASASVNLFTYPPTKEQHIENVRRVLLEGSGLKQEWIDFIRNDDELYGYLLQAVNGLVTYYTGREKQGLIPAEGMTILKGLKYCTPAKVKMIIIGHDPIPDSRLETGLAFSLPPDVTMQNRQRKFKKSGISVERVHEALVAAEFTPGDSLNHEHWARRGVLLLNACLTLDPDNNKNIENKLKKPPKMEKPHFQYWERFTTRLVVKLVTEVNLPTPTFVLCWGTHAKNIGDLLKSKLPEQDYTFVSYNDDHSELLKGQVRRVVITTGHHPTFPPDDPETNKINTFFPTQAKNQFTAIRSYPQYSTLFDQVTPEEALAAATENLQISDEEN